MACSFQVYYVYGFMLLVFLILIIVTVCVTIVGTYFLLNAENYHWQWTSFFSAASTAIYVYLYSIYYYHVKTKMSGFFQTSFYFGYTMMFCLGLGILCGKFFVNMPEVHSFLPSTICSYAALGALLCFCSGYPSVMWKLDKNYAFLNVHFSQFKYLVFFFYVHSSVYFCLSYL